MALVLVEAAEAEAVEAAEAEALYIYVAYILYLCLLTSMINLHQYILEELWIIQRFLLFDHTIYAYHLESHLHQVEVSYICRMQFD